MSHNTPVKKKIYYQDVVIHNSKPTERQLECIAAFYRLSAGYLHIFVCKFGRCLGKVCILGAISSVLLNTCREYFVH